MTGYKNSEGQVVTEQEFDRTKGGTIHTYDDITGRLKKTENIIFMSKPGTTRTWYEYYLDPSESETDIIRQYTGETENHSLTVYLNQQTAHGFEMWDARDYNREGVLRFRSRIVYDSLGRMVSKVNFDIQTDEVMRHSAYCSSKYYYGTDIDTENGLPDLELRFTYEFDERISRFVTYIKDVNETAGEIHTMNVEDFTELFGGDFWNAHPYYHSLYPILPEFPVV